MNHGLLPCNAVSLITIWMLDCDLSARRSPVIRAIFHNLAASGMRRFIEIFGAAHLAPHKWNVIYHADTFDLFSSPARTWHDDFNRTR